MNLFGKLQNEYEQLWKYIIRPTRTPYSQAMLGPNLFKLQGKQVRRIDFDLTNKRGYSFSCSHFIPADSNSFSCVIYMHGNSSNRTEGMEYLGKLIRQNISLVTFDFSGSGNAEGQYVTLGYYEQEDLQEVVDYIRKNSKVKSIALWGRSMGAVTALLYLNKAQFIQAVIVDSPFKSLKALVQDLVKKNSKIPMFLLAGALKIISKTIQDKANFNIYKINPVKYSVPGLHFPIYFLVGIDDELIPTEHTKQLYAAYAGTDKFLKLVKGKHNDSRPDETIDQIVAFLLKKFQGVNIQNQTQNIKIVKDFDFFADKQIQQEQKTADIDFFAQVEANPQIAESIKSQEFSVMNIFSNIFSRGSKDTKKEKTIKDGYQQTRNIIKKKFKGEQTAKTKQQKKKKSQMNQDNRKNLGNLDDKHELNLMEQWAYCYI